MNGRRVDVSKVGGGSYGKARQSGKCFYSTRSAQLSATTLTQQGESPLMGSPGGNSSGLQADHAWSHDHHREVPCATLRVHHGFALS